ncbi:DMT family transporter [Neisseria zalophi]|uniref:Guanidinium exporter n=1 Tax=Neisseria zalophi TaxID=640030 RepID=A0A5J6PZI6_9NEIS|nr:multidrug efflux SMR transporter [Neisseria zalophi]QEY26272.1 QacE family quaternary ammonium compound efflux SMR transporter [Neisseria zalophi]
MTLNWIYLITAGLLEIGWPIGLKLAQTGSVRWPGITMAIVCMAMSGFCLYLAQKSIPMGTAYAVWTGIGAVGAFIVGILFYGDPTTFSRWLGAMLIISGVVVLKISSGH